MTERLGPSAERRFKILSTQFFTKLKTDGSEKMQSWVKNYDVFEQRFVFIPINVDNSHWILAVIVNAGEVSHSLGAETDQHEHAFCILMDPLGKDYTNVIAPILRDFLNSEAKRLGKFDDTEPFNTAIGFPIIWIPTSVGECCTIY